MLVEEEWAVSNLYQGIFWLISDYGDGMNPDLETFELLHFKVPCTADGEILDHDVTLNAKSGKSFSHKAQWASLPKKITQGHSYQYYPRGRVEIRNKKAIIFLNSVMNGSMVTDQIKMLFGLHHPEIKSIRIKCDDSAHYHCWFNDSTIV